MKKKRKKNEKKKSAFQVKVEMAPETEFCPWHIRCREDLGKPIEMLCGYHNYKQLNQWHHCSIYQSYEEEKDDE